VDTACDRPNADYEGLAANDQEAGERDNQRQPIAIRTTRSACVPSSTNNGGSQGSRPLPASLRRTLALASRYDYKKARPWPGFLAFPAGSLSRKCRLHRPRQWSQAARGRSELAS
jgi:hypothetical protein